jgi:catechol 2,3-dioxygenase-like lactoylglutathione lyase family enzyme
VRVTGLDHVQLAAPPGCEEAARAFFGGLLELPELEKPEALRPRGGVWFALPDGRQLHVGVAADFAAAAKAHPAFRVEGYDAFRARLAAAGVAVRDDEIPGVRRFYADDPWGNRLEFVAVP